MGGGRSGQGRATAGGVRVVSAIDRRGVADFRDPDRVQRVISGRLGGRVLGEYRATTGFFEGAVRRHFRAEAFINTSDGRQRREIGRFLTARSARNAIIRAGEP